MNPTPIHIISSNPYEKATWQNYFECMSYQSIELPNEYVHEYQQMSEVHLHLYQLLSGIYDVYRLAYHHFFEVEKRKLTYDQWRIYIKKHPFAKTKVTTMVLLKYRQYVLTDICETFVRFSSVQLKNLQKYIQTKEPFLDDVSYNRVGEGQTCKDGNEYIFTHAIELPFQRVEMMLRKLAEMEHLDEVMS
ncbi:hypothetical protein WDR10_09265 [Kurthia gibsonii]|uniref:hypothetical protein n=1 Tax=Kurthia gibsonii TaxID=33946 RepID=UPI0030CF0465